MVDGGGAACEDGDPDRPRTHRSPPMPQSRSTRSFVRPLIASLGLALAATTAQAAPAADIRALAQQEQQPLLDTLRDLVQIESGSKDLDGLNQIAAQIGRASCRERV